MAERNFATDKGSTVRTYGKFGLAYEIDFDWFEEGACPESRPWIEPSDPVRLLWSCNCCESGGADLHEVIAT